MRLVLATIFALALVGCTSGLDRKIDGASEKSFKTSLAAIKKSAKAEDIARLDNALLVLAISNVSIGFEGGILGAMKKISDTQKPEQLADQLMPVVDGMTGRDIIKAGQKRKKDEATRQLGSVEAEIAKLAKLREEYAATKGILAPIKILESTLRFNSVGAQKMSAMNFTVSNSSDIGLTYLYLRGTVTETASGKVLFSDDINYKLSAAPLLPGESKALRLPNSAPGKWNAADIWGKENLAFAIEVVNADNLAGQKLAASFTPKDVERLATLDANRQLLTQMLAE
ncbi:MAG: hypothetical protein LH481_00555 [Burkholderiales bacterium]|nr:hypothetical protein [Burkholderiales bacterium]